MGQLRALSVVHGVLEQALERCPDERVASVWSRDMCKLPRLLQDLRYFEPRAVADLKEAAAAALNIADNFRLRSVEQPLTLLGSVYVLEGSTLGAIVLRPLYARAFLLAGEEGLSYLHGYGPAVHTRWSQYRQRMNALDLGAQEREQIAEAANEFFAQLYGERGLRFARSDAAWLATLGRYEPAEVLQQVRWLGRVLAGRGMPTILLQVQLELLAEDLAAAVPENKSEYERLSLAAAALHESRRRHLTDEQIQAIAAGFDRAAGPEWVARFPHTGDLLAAAVADELEGCERAVESLRPWLTDPSRFPAAWIAAVESSLAEARRQARDRANGSQNHP